LPLSTEQLARRRRFRRGVGAVIAGLLAFTALAACLSVVKGRSAARSASADAKPSTVAQREPQHAPLASTVATVEPAAFPAPSEAEQALALARTPIVTIASLQEWSRLVGGLNAADRQRAERDLSRSSVTGARSVREAARLELALLWRITAQRAKAQKVLVSLARTATDPVVKKYALRTLSAA